MPNPVEPLPCAQTLALRQPASCASPIFSLPRAAVWCVPALRVPLVHSIINHFRQNVCKKM